MIKTIDENFEVLSKRIFNNEYTLKHPVFGIRSSHQQDLIQEERLFIKKLDKGGIFNQIIIKRKAVNRFHPNKINNKEFWVKAKTHFKLFSVSGAESKNVEEVNKNNLNYSNQIGLFKILLHSINVCNFKLKIFEIGYGYGNVFNLINGTCEYTGIDYTKLPEHREYDNLHVIDKSGIPVFLRKKNYYDIVYSVNVLQHCSQKDRFNYFKEVSKILIPGGMFLFSCFIRTPENKDVKCWGVVDIKKRAYCGFLNQFTEVDDNFELLEIYNKFGFEILNHKVIGDNQYSCVLRKK